MSSAPKIAKELIEKSICNNAYVINYDSFCLGIPFRETSIADVHYFIQAKTICKKDIILIGVSEEQVICCRDFFKLLGIRCDTLNLMNYPNKCPDVLYRKNMKNCICVVLEGAENETARLIGNYHLDDGMFISSEDRRRFNTVRSFDPNLGFDKHGSMYRLSNHDSVSSTINPVKIVILGNSCTDSRLFTEKSWPEYLLDYYTEEDIYVEMFEGAVTGHAVSQELVKLIRDGIGLSPDIVISFSGTNEWLDDSDNLFTNRYQMRIIKEVVDCKHIRLLMASNVTDNSHDVSMGVHSVVHIEDTVERARHWYRQERIMHTICNGDGISFFAFIQPHLLGKHPKSTADIELIEHINMIESSKQSHNILSEIERLYGANEREYPYIYNMARVFDEETKDVYMDYNHMLGRGNQIIAQKVFEIIR